MTLTFTKSEMIEYLVMAGYIIETQHVETEIHLHGSRFMSEIHVQAFARKDDLCEPVDDVFRDLIKKKLLGL